MARGDNEQACLDFVREHISENAGFCRIYPELLDLVDAAVANSNLNCFPDFVASDGRFIEHFEVSASVESKKGSALRRAESTIERKFDAEDDQFRDKLLNEHDGSFLIEASIERVQPVSVSYSDFVKSFRRNWEKHIHSCQDVYHGRHGLGAFLVDMRSCPLMMHFSGGEDLPYSFYRDGSMLKYLFGFKDDIDFVIFACLERIDFIRLSDIDQILDAAVVDEDACIGAVPPGAIGHISIFGGDETPDNIGEMIAGIVRDQMLSLGYDPDSLKHKE